MSTALEVLDGEQTVVEDTPAGRLYRLAPTINGLVATTTAEQLGPALSALIGQAQAALADYTLGGVAVSALEGGDDGPSCAVDIAHEGGCSGAFAMSLAVLYWQPAGGAPQREVVLSALSAAVAANAGLTQPTLRERCLAALRTRVGDALALSGVPLKRNADRPAQGASAQVIMRDGDQTADHETLGRTRYAVDVVFEVVVPEGSAAALDAIVQVVLGAIQTADRLGGIAEDVVELDVEPDVAREGGPTWFAAVGARMWFSALTGDPVVQAS